MTVPPYQPPSQPTDPTQMRCPKCQGSMRTYERNGIHLEQCDTCRGIFLDFGELEALTQLENRFTPAPAPPPQAQPSYSYGPDWSYRGGHRYRKGGFGRLFFSS